jgi:oligopeptide/dipeptide ABC transporter ATP-binding protein
MDKLLEVRHLKKYFPIRKGLLKKTIGYIKAVDDVSFEVARGETFGLVGESGCGKTTVGKTVLRLLEATDGEVLLEGEDICKLNKEELRKKRRDMQIVFQDPYGSLNPRMTIEAIIAEPIKEHKLASGAEVTEQVEQLMHDVGLNTKEMKKYPHEFSGGQRQRVAIARALAVSPKLIVCDEPVSALDVSIQAQILNLLHDIQEKKGVAYLFIAHGMPAVKFMSHNVGVMYMGQLVEVAPAKKLFAKQLHPYSIALISAVPIANPEKKSNRIILNGEIPDLRSLPSGCRFSTRCSYACERCVNETPQLQEVLPEHFVACHFVSALDKRK